MGGRPEWGRPALTYQIFANLTDADLSNATLFRASLGNADLRRADLTGANLRAASVTYTVLTPQEAIGDLQHDIQTLVDDGVLNNGQANGLTKPLDNAIRSLDKGKTAAACNQLQDFISEVNAKTPQPLDAARAADLIADAEAIQVSIGCE